MSVPRRLRYLDDASKRQILMVKCALYRISHLRQHISECASRREASADRQRIDELANDRFELRPAAAGAGRADFVDGSAVSLPAWLVKRRVGSVPPSFTEQRIVTYS